MPVTFLITPNIYEKIPPSLTEGTNNNNIQNKTNKSSISEYNYQTIEFNRTIINIIIIKNAFQILDELY